MRGKAFKCQTYSFIIKTRMYGNIRNKIKIKSLPSVGNLTSLLGYLMTTGCTGRAGMKAPTKVEQKKYFYQFPQIL